MKTLTQYNWRVLNAFHDYLQEGNEHNLISVLNKVEFHYQSKHGKKLSVQIGSMAIPFKEVRNLVRKPRVESWLKEGMREAIENEIKIFEL